MDENVEPAPQGKGIGGFLRSALMIGAFAGIGAAAWGLWSKAEEAREGRFGPTVQRSGNSCEVYALGFDEHPIFTVTYDAGRGQYAERLTLEGGGYLQLLEETLGKDLPFQPTAGRLVLSDAFPKDGIVDEVTVQAHVIAYAPGGIRLEREEEKTFSGTALLELGMEEGNLDSLLSSYRERMRVGERCY